VWCCLGLSGVVWYRLVFDIRGEGRAAGIPGLEREWHSKASGESRRWECLCPGLGRDSLGRDQRPWLGRVRSSESSEKAQQLRTQGLDLGRFCFAVVLCCVVLTLLRGFLLLRLFRISRFRDFRPGTLSLARPYFWVPRRLSFASLASLLPPTFPPLPLLHLSFTSPLRSRFLSLPSCRVGLPWEFSDFSQRHANIAFELSSFPSPPFYIKLSRGGETMEEGSRG
jgi:hypothetical protein